MASILGVLFRHPPYGQRESNEAFDTVLAGSTLFDKVYLFFIGNGLYNLFPSTNHPENKIKNIAAQLQGLPLYDVHDFFILDSEASTLPYQASDLCLPVTSCAPPLFQQRMNECTALLSF